MSRKKAAQLIILATLLLVFSTAAQAQTFTVRVECWSGTQHFYGTEAFAEVSGPSIETLLGVGWDDNWEWEFNFPGYAEPQGKADPYYNRIWTGVRYYEQVHYQLRTGQIWYEGTEVVIHSVPW